MRHYTRLSDLNYGVDNGMYPLGSCTMKYNPKMAEAMAEALKPVHPGDEAAMGSILGLLSLLQQHLGVGFGEGLDAGGVGHPGRGVGLQRGQAPEELLRRRSAEHRRDRLEGASSAQAPANLPSASLSAAARSPTTSAAAARSRA